MTTGPTMRERSRRAVRDQIAAVAMGLFAERGFEATTVGQIAEAAGMSSRTFFRYFSSKEEVVIGDPLEFGERVRDHLDARPGDEPALEAVTHAFAALVHDVEANPAAVGISALMMSTPSLRAYRLEKQRVWVDLLLPGTVARLGGREHADLSATAIVQAVMAAFDAALVVWADDDGRAPLGPLFAAAVHATRA